MTVPDVGPRFVVDAQPTVRVLDRAYCFQVVKEWDRQPRRRMLDQADVYADRLNRDDRQAAKA